MSFYEYRPVTGSTKKFETSDGDESATEVPKHDLKNDLRTALTESAASLATAVSHLNTISGSVDGLEALQTAANGFVDGLEALITTLNALVTTQSGHVDGLEALSTSTNSKLDTVVTNLDPATCTAVQVASTNSSAAFANSAVTLGVIIKNISTGGQKTYIKPGGTASAADGFELAVGEKEFFPCTNTNQLEHFSTASGANLCLLRI